LKKNKNNKGKKRKEKKGLRRDAEKVKVKGIRG
jgi:hypothetical protein